MTSHPVLIYTSGNNTRLAQITTEAGWLVGMRSDKTPCGVHIDFMDIDYEHPKFNEHLAMVKEHHPRFAIVPDLSDIVVDKADISRALHQAEQLAPHCEQVILVPKLSGQITHIPHDFVIGYSVPTTNGAAKYGVWKLAGRRVHLLGGNPHLQMKLYREMQSYSNVISVDGNMPQLMSGFGKYWRGGKWVKHPRSGTNDTSVSYECVAWSLKNIRRAWEGIPEGLPEYSLWSA